MLQDSWLSELVQGTETKKIKPQAYAVAHNDEVSADEVVAEEPLSLAEPQLPELNSTLATMIQQEVARYMKGKGVAEVNCANYSNFTVNSLSLSLSKLHDRVRS